VLSQQISSGSLGGLTGPLADQFEPTAMSTHPLGAHSDFHPRNEGIKTEGVRIFPMPIALRSNLPQA
jgi:hypothetical protein